MAGIACAGGLGLWMDHESHVVQGGRMAVRMDACGLGGTAGTRRSAEFHRNYSPLLTAPHFDSGSAPALATAKKTKVRGADSAGQRPGAGCGIAAHWNPAVTVV